MQRGFAHLLPLLVLLLALVGGGWLYLNSQNPKLLPPPTTTPDNPITEKTYSNKDLGFEFKYPAELTAQEDSEEEYFKRSNGNIRKNFTSYVGYAPGEFLGAVVAFSTEIPNRVYDPFGEAPFTVWVFKNPANLTEVQWFNEYWYYPFNWGQFSSADKAKVAPQNDATISGKLAKYGVVSHYPGKPKYIYLSNEGRMYLFRVFTENNVEGEKILNSFKFLSVNNETADWKTYTNAKFSISYPEGWDVKEGNESVKFRSPDLEREGLSGPITNGVHLVIETNGYGPDIVSSAKTSFLDCTKSTKVLDTFIDGYPASKYTYYCPGSNPEAFAIFIQVNEKVYSIDYDFQPWNDQEIESQIDKMISSFDILK